MSDIFKKIMKYLKKNTISLILAATWSCTGKQEYAVPLNPLQKYDCEIVKTETKILGLTQIIYVKIGDRLSKDQLNEVAMYIMDLHEAPKRKFIIYQLPDFPLDETRLYMKVDLKGLILDESDMQWEGNLVRDDVNFYYLEQLYAEEYYLINGSGALEFWGDGNRSY